MSFRNLALSAQTEIVEVCPVVDMRLGGGERELGWGWVGRMQGGGTVMVMVLVWL